MQEKKCLMCEKRFVAKNNQAKYCSSLCKGRVANSKKRLPIVTKNCLNCNNEFIVRNSGIENKYCCKKCSRQYYNKNNREKINIVSNKRRRERYREDPIFKYNNIKRSTVYRKLSFNISYQDFINNFWKKKCTYCGLESDQGGIDRVNSFIGYELNNCVPCCTTCNMMKQAHSVTNFFSHIKQIYEHSKLNKLD